MCARIAELDSCPLSTLANDHILDFAEPVWEGFTPAVIIGLVGIFPRKFLAAGDILEITAFGNYGCASIGVAHVPRFVKLSDNLFGLMHFLATFLRMPDKLSRLHPSVQWRVRFGLEAAFDQVAPLDRSATIAASRRWSATETAMEIPVRMTQIRTNEIRRESQIGLFRLGQTTSFLS